MSESLEPRAWELGLLVLALAGAAALLTHRCWSWRIG